ncbi:Uncharacterised protein [Campylobacter hyointestinalis subsp. hyointestinalis]|uniref:Uncharacterized protein n=1 Tax=Campylobacter hyointestinalis subsp. hyointestinalis TaxID=91352 RepID=A0A0S4SW10_CAMHY|nr:hypothetical protein [Campylobacter hyointestinalis]CUU90690.1 Uncharacterised protein [Campylobacter hyointestinalis subsp. hyointestinalis]
MIRGNSTKTIRISSWVYDFFYDRANKKDINLPQMMDDLAETLKLLDNNEVILNEVLDKCYKEYETNIPRSVFEALSALMNYSNKLYHKFSKYGFIQFIDRYNIVAYYVNSHVCMNIVRNAATREELKQKAESIAAMSFLFGKNTSKAIDYANDIINKIDPHKNAYISINSKSTIMTEIFNHKELMKLLQDELILVKEDEILELYKFIIEKYDIENTKQTAFRITLKSSGLINKIAYLIFQDYKNGKLDTLPSFVNEEFLSDLFSLFHDYVHAYYSPELCYAKAIESALIIAQAIKDESNYHMDDMYLKGNLIDNNKFDNLEDALKNAIDTFSLKTYTSITSAEFNMRTPMHILDHIAKTNDSYVTRISIQKIILKHLINVCYPIYNQIVKDEGKIFNFTDLKRETNMYSNDKSAQIAISMSETGYVNLILYISVCNESLRISLNLKHSSLEKIDYCLKAKIYYQIQIEEDLSIYCNENSTSITLKFQKNDIYLQGKTMDSFVEILDKYISSDDFTKNKRIDFLNNGAI